MSTYSNKNIFWLHHYEACWEPSIQKVAGISFDEYTDQIADFINNSEIDHVIITLWEGWQAGEEHYPLLRFLDDKGISHQVETVPYGSVEEMFWEKDYPNLIPSRKTEGETNPSIKEVVYIEDWMRELVSAKNVMLAGAFEGECVSDAEDILDHVIGEDNYKRIEGLIIGTGIPYEYKSKKEYLYEEDYTL